MTSVQERADLISKLGLDGQNKAALGQVPRVSQLRGGCGAGQGVVV
jgi:hypothetical protein